MPKPLIPEMQNALLAISNLLGPIAAANSHGFCLVVFPVGDECADVTYITNLNAAGLIDTLGFTITAIQERDAALAKEQELEEQEPTGTIQ